MPRRHAKRSPTSLLSFPADLNLHIMGHNQPDFPARVLAALQRHQPDLTEAALTTHPSREGRYLAVNISLTVPTQAEMEAIYRELGRVEGLILAI